MTRSLRLAQKIYADGSKLTASDLLSKEDYERERADLLRLATQHRRQRRLRLNPSLSLVFETRSRPGCKFKKSSAGSPAPLMGMLRKFFYDAT